VKTPGFKRRERPGSTLTFLRFTLCGAVLAGALAVPGLCRAQCGETPTVLMDERTAETHLLARRDLELSTNAPGLAGVKKVTLLVTVDREGAICDAQPVAGPPELRSRAVRAVKMHWRYRPFLVDWKPVVARFPVTVRFVTRKPEPRLMALARCSPLIAIGLMP
jgi:hypothetical protein